MKQKALSLGTFLGISLFASLLLLLLLSFFLFRFGMLESLLSLGINAVYLFSTLLGGFLIGKKQKEKRYLWGLLLGLLYFALLLLFSALCGLHAEGFSSSILTPFLLCMLGGTLGGMLGM